MPISSTLKEIIKAFGGSGPLSRELKLPIGTVSIWRIRGIPWKWRPIIADMAKARKIKLPKDFLNARAA